MADSAPWYVLRVAPQRERHIAGEIKTALGLKTYVPIEIVRMPKRGVVFERRRPLVPGYVFVRGIEDGVWSDVKATDHVIGWLASDGKPAVVHNHEIERIDLLTREHNAKLRDTFTFRPGERVREPGGPFSSVEYLLSSVRGETVKLEAMMDGRRITRRTTVDQLERVA
mgnify:CR=1 FL=1